MTFCLTSSSCNIFSWGQEKFKHGAISLGKVVLCIWWCYSNQLSSGQGSLIHFHRRDYKGEQFSVVKFQPSALRLPSLSALFSFPSFQSSRLKKVILPVSYPDRDTEWLNKMYVCVLSPSGRQTESYRGTAASRPGRLCSQSCWRQQREASRVAAFSLGWRTHTRDCTTSGPSHHIEKGEGFSLRRRRVLLTVRAGSYIQWDSWERGNGHVSGKLGGCRGAAHFVVLNRHFIFNSQIIISLPVSLARGCPFLKGVTFYAQIPIYLSLNSK